MGWIPDDILEELSGSHRLGIFINIQTDPALHIWFGTNDIPAQIDSIDSDGTVYIGGGYLVGIPTLETQINGTSDSVDFILSGIDPATGAKLIETLPAVRRREIYVGITTLDDYYQPMSDIIPIWQGLCSHISEASQSASGTDNKSIALSLSVTTGSDTRSRAARSLWTSAQQKAISSTDKFCDQVAKLARGVAPVWPRY